MYFLNGTHNVIANVSLGCTGWDFKGNGSKVSGIFIQTLIMDIHI